MAGKPVALEGGNQGLDTVTDIRGQGGKGHEQESHGEHENTEAAVLDPPFHNDIEQNEAQAKKMRDS